jgi:predicted nuclease of predicted toxin-antitoxin system
VIALAVDENFDHHILRALLRRLPELDFRLVQSQGLEGVDDRVVLAWAASQNRVLVTHDVRTVTRYAHERVERGEQYEVRWTSHPGLVIL